MKDSFKKKHSTGNRFSGPPVPVTCEACMMKVQSPCITANCGRAKQKNEQLLLPYDFPRTSDSRKSCDHNHLGENHLTLGKFFFGIHFKDC